MAFKINEFRKSLPHGGARANLFRVLIPSPDKWVAIITRVVTVTYLLILLTTIKFF